MLHGRIETLLANFHKLATVITMGQEKYVEVLEGIDSLLAIHSSPALSVSRQRPAATPSQIHRQRERR